MAITISGVNNNDRIVATDGTIDALSGFNVVGVMTAASFSGDLVGNVTGNLTGNVNSTSPLLLQTGGSERIRLTGNTEIGIAGANYGTAGQVLTSGGSGNAVSWTTISGGVTSDSEENTVGGTNAGNALDSDTYRNTLFGYDTGKLINSGDDNTIIGWKAGDAITSGYKNCAVGSEALPNCNSGHNNVAMGWEAGRSLTSGNNNVMLGPMAGRTIGGGTYNIALGYHSLSNVGSPTRCIGIGGDSVFLGGTDVIGMGQGTMMKGNSQIGGIGIGRYAGRNNAGDYNVYVGYEAGHGTNSSPYAIGNYNISLGYRSLYNITSASSNVAIGASAGDVLTTGGNNIILGDGADASSATISNEVTIGNSSINHVRVPGIGVSFSAGGAVISGIVTATNFVKADGSTVGFSPDAQNNLFAGTDAGASLNSNSSDNILLGQDAGDSITEGEYNVCIGLRAGQALTDVDKNVCIGNDAGRNNNSSSNVFVGWYAGAGAGSNGNVCIGHQAGSEANGNETAYGYSSGPTASYSGTTNVCMGFASGNGLRSSASRNTILGPGAGRNDSVGQVNINGSDNIILGSYSSLSSVSASNECVIGAVYGSSKAINHLRVPGIGVSFSAGGAVISGIVTASAFKLSDGSTVGGVSSDAAENVLAGTNAGGGLVTGAEKNTIIGHNAGLGVTTGDKCVIIGHSASKHTHVSNQVAIGYEALMYSGNSTPGYRGDNHTAIGYQCMKNLGIYVNYNTAVGAQAMANATSGFNAAFGYGALASGSGEINTAIGMNSLDVCNGSWNSALGYKSGDDCTSGSKNSLIGVYAGEDINGGSHNLCLGAYSTVSASGVSNEAVIGAPAGHASVINHVRMPGIGVSFSAGGAVISGIVTATGIDLSGEVAASQDYPNFRPSLDLNFASTKKLDSIITYTRSGRASFINEHGLVEIVNANVPRFDHDPVTRECKGLLIEEERTNLLTYSNVKGMSSPNLGGNPQTNDTVSNITLPTGEKGDVRRYLANASGGGGRWGDYSGTNNTSYTGSVWIRTVSGTTSAILDINDGGGKTVSLTTEWQRVTTTYSSNNTYRFFDIYFGSPTTIYYWGVQIEAGAFMTSYIPTNNATATRGGDRVYIPIDDGLDFYNPVESTILVDYTHQDGVTSSNLGTNARLYRFRATSGADTRIDYVSNTGYNPYIARDGSSPASLSHGQQTVFGGGLNRNAVRVKENSFAVSFNGSAVVEDTSGNWDPANAIDHVTLGGYNDSFSGQLSGHIQRFTYYPIGVSNSQLVTLTS